MLSAQGMRLLKELKKQGVPEAERKRRLENFLKSTEGVNYKLKQMLRAEREPHNPGQQDD